MLPRQFKALVDALRSELALLRNQYEQQTNAIREASDAERERANLPAPTPIIHSELHLPNDISDQIRAYSQQSQRKRIAKSVWEGLGIAAAIAAAIFTGIQAYNISQQTAQIYHQSEVENAGVSHRAFEVDRQLRSAQEQAIAASKSVVQLQKQVEASNHALQVSERPWVGAIPASTVTAFSHGIDPANGQDTMQIEVLLSVKNFGKSPALRVMYGEFTADDPPKIKPSQDFECSSNRKFAEQKIMSFEDSAGHRGDIDAKSLGGFRRSGIAAKEGWHNIHLIEKYGFTLFPSADDVTIQASSIPVPKVADAQLYFAGCIIYADQFDENRFHETRFCEKSPGAWSKLAVGVKLLRCNTHNAAK